MAMFRLLNPTRDYAWGSEDFIPRLLCKEPVRGKPVAELWLGAHPASPSMILAPGGEISLADYIRDNPQASLGRGNHNSQAALPFLLKVLAAARPLSIQAHPSRESAKLGFARENSLGVPLDSPRRNYRDPNHKPELICALTPFRALCGFRPYEEVVSLFRMLGLESHFSAFTALARFVDQRSFQRFVVQLLSLPAELAEPLLGDYESALKQGRLEDPDLTAVCLGLLNHYPRDLGTLAPLYLRVFDLTPGEALYLGSGIMHAYLEGAGVEIMANSDNVLRGGLTPKHVDVPELAAILDFSTYQKDKILPEEVEEGCLSYPCKAEEFWLRRLSVAAGMRLSLPTNDRPQIYLCDEGEVLVSAENEKIRLGQGDSLFVGADTGSLFLQGSGKRCMATSGFAQN